MGIDLNRLFVCVPSRAASLEAFVEHWAALYDYANDASYSQNIIGPHTVRGLRELFLWKIGKRFFTAKLPLLNECFIDRRKHAAKLVKQLGKCDPRETARQFLDVFDSGGVVWRIFWLHCWCPRLPIYDQHVHRAMTFLVRGECEELGKFNDALKVQLYLDAYLPFFTRFDGIDGRKVDRALWRFGKSLKEKSVPIPLGSANSFEHT